MQIRGATASEERLIRTELLRFDGEVGTGRVLIPTVVVRKPTEQDADGSIGRHSGRITLEAGQTPDRIRQVVRHELCHALDFSEELTAHGSPADAFAGPLAAWLGDPHILASPSWYQHAEAFAWACEVGPHVAAALAEPCSEESDELGPMFRWLRDVVWQGSAGRLEPVVIGVPAPAFLDVEGDELSVFMNSTPDETLVLWPTPDGSPYLVDRTNSELVAIGRVGKEAPKDECDLRELPDDISTARYGTAAGPAVVIAWFNRFYLEDSEARWFGRQGEEPFGYGGCVPPGISLDAGEGEIWAAWMDEDGGVFGEVSVE